jgi:WD40 repeat protein
LAQCQAHLQAAVSSIPNSVSIQQALILEQFDVLRKAVEDNQARALQNLAALQATVTTHLQQELANCNSYAQNLTVLSNQYPASVMPIDVPTWNEESEVWSKNLAVMSQHGLVGDFVADIPVAIAEPTLSYEGNSVDFASLWSRGKETVTGTIRVSPSAEPLKPVHFITQSASGILRRWDFRDAITISEINHPGLRNWSLFEDGTKVVAASAKIKVYDTLSGACLFTFDSLPSPAKKIIAGGRDLKARAISFHVNQGSAALWDLSQGTRLQWDSDISAWNTNLAITSAPDSNLLLIPIIAFPFDVIFFNMLTGDVEPDRLEGFLSEVVDLLPFGSGQFCVTLCSGGSCSIWSLKERRILKTTQFDPKHNRLTLHVISNKRLFDPEPLLPIIGAYSNLGASFATFDPNTGRSLSFTHNNSVLLTSSLRSMVIFGKGTRALSGHANGKVHVWSLETGACTDTIPMSITGQFTLCNRGHSIVVGTPNGFLNRIDAATCTFQPLLPSVLDGSGIQAQLIGTNFRV